MAGYFLLCDWNKTYWVFFAGKQSEKPYIGILQYDKGRRIVSADIVFNG